MNTAAKLTAFAVGTAFDTQHGKRMHLIVARRDLSGFRHVRFRPRPRARRPVITPSH